MCVMLYFLTARVQTPEDVAIYLLNVFAANRTKTIPLYVLPTGIWFGNNEVRING